MREGERADDRTCRERHRSPTGIIRGNMALVWAPYEFQINGATTHRGIDVFSLARIDGAWKVSNSMWTVEPDACSELRPPGSGNHPAGRVAHQAAFASNPISGHSGGDP